MIQNFKLVNLMWCTGTLLIVMIDSLLPSGDPYLGTFKDQEYGAITIDETGP